MHRRFIALVLSASLAITTVSAAPARANDADKWVAGAVGLAILGLYLHEEDKKKRKRKAQAYYHQQQLQQQKQHKHHGYSHSHKNGHHKHSHKKKHDHTGPIIIKPKKNIVNNRHKRLPSACLVTKRFHGQKIRGFMRGCLKRNNVRVRNLPKQCKYKIYNPQNGNTRVIFGSRCLKQSGYRVARAH